MEKRLREIQDNRHKAYSEKVNPADYTPLEDKFPKKFVIPGDDATF